MSTPNRLEVLHAAIDLAWIDDDDANQERREWIKGQTHEWSTDVLIETLLDAVEMAVMKATQDAEEN